MPRFSGERLKELRGRRTQIDVAAALRSRGYGTTQTQVSRWEAGQAPRKYILPALAEVLGSTEDDLFVEDEAEAASVEPLSAEALARDLHMAIERIIDAQLGRAIS